MTIARLRLRFQHWRNGHNWRFTRNVYGDEINWCGGYRSVWDCNCGARKWGRMLHENRSLRGVKANADQEIQ